MVPLSPARLLPKHCLALTHTEEVEALVQDLHAAFSLFASDEAGGAPSPPTFEAGLLKGGGVVAPDEIELVLEAFGS
eukprot:3660882-Pleurochrysis_carterae.AAC.1